MLQLSQALTVLLLPRQHRFLRGSDARAAAPGTGDVQSAARSVLLHAGAGCGRTGVLPRFRFCLSTG